MNIKTNPIPLEMLLEQLPVNIYWKNTEGVFLGCNEANRKSFGLNSASDYVGKKAHDIFPTDEADEIERNDQEVMRTGKPIVVEESGTTGLFLSHKAPLRDENGQIIGLLGASINITHTKK